MILDYVLRSTLRSRARVKLSIVGVALGAALITLIFALTGDLSSVMVDSFTVLYGGEALLLPDQASFGRLPTGFLGFKYDNGGLGKAVPWPSDSLAGPRSATPIFILAESFSAEGHTVAVLARGDFQFGEGQLKLTGGRYFTAQDSGKQVVMLNHSAARRYPVGSSIELFIPRLPVDDAGNIHYEFSRLAPVTFEVIGHYRPPLPLPFVPATNPQQRAIQALMPIDAFLRVTEITPGWAMAVSVPEGTSSAPGGYHILPAEEMAMAMVTGARVRDSSRDDMETVAVSYTWVIFITSSVVIVVTLWIALRQRSVELAILRTQGWKARHLMFALGTENFLVGFVGGLLGYAVAVVLLVTVISSVGGNPLRLSGIQPSKGALLAFALGMMCVLACILPIRRAAKVLPAEVLRSE